MSFSNYLENALLNTVFGGTIFSPSGTLYVALGSGNPGESGVSICEPSTSYNYLRVAITNDKANWSTATSGVLTNMVALQYPQANNDWGQITYFGIYDSSGVDRGNMYGYGNLVVPKYVYNGDTPTFASGSLQISLD
jgi:hypothetical protein